MEWLILLAILVIGFIFGLYATYLFRILAGVLELLLKRQYNMKKQIQEVRRYVGQEHKKIRKETQELKVRATQDRKDLNDIQRTLKKKSK